MRSDLYWKYCNECGMAVRGREWSRVLDMRRGYVWCCRWISASLELYLCEYVVFEREARVFPSFHFFMFQLRDSNQKSITHSSLVSLTNIITTRKSMLEWKLDCDENSNTNARTQVRERWVRRTMMTRTIDNFVMMTRRDPLISSYVTSCPCK